MDAHGGCGGGSGQSGQCSGRKVPEAVQGKRPQSQGPRGRRAFGKHVLGEHGALEKEGTFLLVMNFHGKIVQFFPSQLPLASQLACAAD